MEYLRNIFLCFFVVLLCGCVPGAGGGYYGESLFGLSPGSQNIRVEKRKDLVMEVQVALRKLGYKRVGVADGIYGRKTKDAVLAFQADKGISQDGRVTYGLLKKLRKECRLAGISLSQAYKKNKRKRASRVSREGKKLVATMGTLGGVAGAVIGGVAANDPTIGAAVGTVVGVGVGTAVAGVINSETMRRFDNYIENYNKVEDDIKATSNKFARLKKEIAAVELRVAAREKKIAELEKRAKGGEDLHGEANAMLAELEQELRCNKKLSNKIRKDILILKKNIKDISGDIKRNPRSQSLKRKKEKKVIL